MPSTFDPQEAACQELLARCLDSGTWPVALLDEVRRGTETLEGSRAFFRIVVERLGDLFEPRLCDVYARLFTELIGEPELFSRYQRIRQPRPLSLTPRRVYVLSRVTLGADIAVTSVLLDAAKQRFPRAEIVLVGSRKSGELFAADDRITLQEVTYGRGGSLAERLAVRPDLWDDNGIVLDPDSRLTQLGLLPVCAEDRYFFFESRSYGGDSNLALPELASRWCEEVLGVAGQPYLALRKPGVAPARATVSLGVGENPAKRVADPFEAELLRLLPDDTLIDQGAGGEEQERVRRAARAPQRLFQGGFAEFAALIAQSDRFVGYDSAGMHAAAALSVPLVCVFAGAVSNRMFERWKPTGPAPCHVIRVTKDTAVAELVAAVEGALTNPSR